MMMTDVELNAARIIVQGALRAGRLSAGQIAEYLHLPIATVERICCELDDPLTMPRPEAASRALRA